MTPVGHEKRIVIVCIGAERIGVVSTGFLITEHIFFLPDGSLRL